MRRADSTSVEYQSSYRGRHLARDGRDGYDGRLARYLGCTCGWKLRDVTPRQTGAARTLFKSHVSNMKALRQIGVGKAKENRQ